MSKCEHGLTSKECYVCASPKYGKHDARPCTCHPDDNPPVPCPQKFALSECKAAAPVAAPAPDAATVELPPLPDIEQEVYARTRTFLRNDEIVAVGQLMEVYASEAIRAAHPAPAPDDARDAPHIAPFRLLVAACNRLSAEAEEYTFDDGMGRGALQDYWDEFEAALERARESLND